MLDSSKILAGNVLEASPNVEMKTKEQHETLDNLIKQTLTSDSFLSFSKAEKSPVQWFHLLDTLDQQNLNNDLSSSKLEMALDCTGHRQGEMVGYDSKAGEGPATKSSSCAKGGNLFGKGLQTSEDKFPSLKFPEAMVAIAQAAKDIPGWPLMSTKITMHKCEKCSQEFSSPLNQRRHLRATHRRPLNGDKEDLKSKKEQIALFWDKLTVEEACEIVSYKNLSLGDLSASSLVRALSNHLQQPGLLSLPQSYIKVAALLLDIVQSKSSQYPLNSEELFSILEDASERNMLSGVTSSSMQRCIFGSDPGRVGLETRNLVSSLGFLVELRLVKAWMDDKDAEALRCQNALVEEEEAAQKKRAKLQERRRQQKMRHKESKDKDKKAVDLSGLKELKLDFFSHKEEDSPTTTTSSLSGFSGADTSPNETPDGALLDTEGGTYSNVSSSCLADDQFRYSDYQEDLEPQNAPLEQGGDSRKPLLQSRHTNEYGVVEGRGWNDRRHGDFNYLPSHLKYGLSNDRKGFEHQFGDQWLRKPCNTVGSSAQEFSKMNTFRYSQYREKFPVLKRSTSVAGSGHAVWTRKALQTFDVSHHDENGQPVESEIVKDALEAAAGKLEVDPWPANSGEAEGLSHGSSLSLDSITSHSSSSVSARIGTEDQERCEDTVLPPQTALGEGTLVIGSVTIAFGDPWSGNPSDAKLVREWEDKYMPNEEDMNSAGELAPKEVAAGFSPATLSADGVPQLNKSASMGTVAPLTWKDAPPYHPLSESSAHSKCYISTLLNKPGVLKVWRPITERNDTFTASLAGIESAEGQEEDAAIMHIVCREEGSGYAGSHALPSADRDLDDTSYIRHQDCDNEPASTRSVFAVEKRLFDGLVEPLGQAGSNFLALKGDIATLLHRRWDDATSLADAVYHQDFDESDILSHSSATDDNSFHVNESSSL